MEKITEYLIRPTVHEKGVVRAWEETVMLPTYAVGEEEKNPIFLEKRVYQGSSGAVYPYPVIEKIFDNKQDRPYRALFIENEYIKLMILPELGGRLQMAYDKVKNRHFVYYNQVIKPALVGLLGPWISGGIEFNWPQHHRPSTFKPTDYSIEEHSDGSMTVWCNEVERMFRTKGMHGFRLYPGKAYVEINIKIYNGTAFPQTFLWWANPAVTVNDAYKSVFPPDVHAVFDHGKRDVSSFPIATSIYYKHDYSPGVDISKYKNIPVPTSYMAVKSRYDFVGGYEDDINAGLLHVADHHISPGKKQWTWGCGDFGLAWDRNLTDEDGPYIELMTGVYTENQPDFSWLQPYEEKRWTQYFMPYSSVGYVKNATKDAVVNVEVENGMATVDLYMTSEFENLGILLKSNYGEILIDDRASVSPQKPYKRSVDSGKLLPEEIIFELTASDGRILLTYCAEKPMIKPIPNPANAPCKPQDIDSTEQLYLTGLHLEQYRHATYDPLDYYFEALRRESCDERCNNAVGLIYMRRGQFAKAESYFHRAVETLTERNSNPYDGEPYYNLGLNLKMQGKWDEAYECFAKSAWNAAWQDPAYLEIARIDYRNKRFSAALGNAERSLVRNWHNHKARQLKVSALRKMGRTEEALKWITDSLEIDSFNMGCRFEKYLITKDEVFLDEMNRLMRFCPHTYIEYALDFAAAGMFEEGEALLLQCITDGENTYPMVYYTLGYLASRLGRAAQAREYFRKAAKMPFAGCFPNRIEDVLILSEAMEINPEDAKAPYYLGNFWYAARQYGKAIECWEKSAELDDRFPSAFRNLSLAYYNKLNDKETAKALLERAFELDETDARIFMELDQLYKRLGVSPVERLKNLEKYLPLVEQREDLLIERITLYNFLRHYEKALELIDSCKFHPWEGGEGKVTGQYVQCRIGLAKQAIDANDFERALVLLKETEKYPPHLGEGKLINAEENDVYYYKAIAYRGLGDENNARACLEKAVTGMQEPRQAFFYNDPQPDRIYFQGQAWRAAGNEEKACECFNKLISHGEKYLFENCEIDYFAVSLPELAIWEEDLNKRNRIHCNYVMALGHLGLNQTDKAEEFFEKVAKEDANHPGLSMADLRIVSLV